MISERRGQHGLLIGVVASFALGFFLSYSQILSLAFGGGAHGLKYLFSRTPVELSTLELLGDLSLARDALEQNLMRDYGEYYGLVFDRAAMENVFLSNPKSRERLLRRLMLKILSGGSFTWVTAGDGAAAGHGNLFSQSYTAVMESTAKDAFRKLNINFVAKNYGMGGYVSAPELAMCMESVYGTDIDILMWDFGLMEVDDRAMLWCHRAALHPTKPILFAMDNVDGERWNSIFLSMEDSGMGAFLMDHHKGLNDIRQRAPDAVRGAGGKGRIPLPLKNYRCNGSFEGVVGCDDPMRHFKCYNVDDNGPCIEEKFKTKHKCMDAKYQTSWHPGWKEHYIKGRLLGVFLVEMLNEALIQLDARVFSHGSRDAVLQSLLAKEQADVALARNAPIPALGHAFSQYESTVQQITPRVLYKQPAICQTALLPAQERYDGILLESGKQSSPMAGDYDRGQNRVFMTEPIKDGKLPLVFDPNDRQRCVEELEIDHKDFFWIRQGDGWLSRTIPNDSELAVYGKPLDMNDNTFTATLHTRVLSNRQPEGLIMVCLKICPLKRCPDDSVGFGPLRRSTNQISIKVDGRSVTNVQKFGDCHFLEGEQGLRWGPGKNGKGQYRLSFIVNDRQKNNMKISSFVVF